MSGRMQVPDGSGTSGTTTAGLRDGAARASSGSRPARTRRAAARGVLEAAGSERVPPQRATGLRLRAYRF